MGQHPRRRKPVVCINLWHQLRKHSGTGNFMIPVLLFDLKFLTIGRDRSRNSEIGSTSVQPHRASQSFKS
jgi:hypothetical protein